MINFESIIKRSAVIIRKHWYLWLLGILSGGMGAGLNNINYLWDSNSSDNIKIKDIWPSSGDVASVAYARVKDLGQVLGEKIGPSSMGDVNLWIVVALAAVVLILALLYIGITAKGALIQSVYVLDNKENVNFSKAWAMGHKMFWRRLSFELMLILILFLPIAILISIPIIFGVLGMMLAAMISLVIVAIAVIFFVIYASLVIPVAERELFIAKKPIWKALASGYKLFQKRWSHFLLAYLIILGFSIGVGIIIGIVMLLVGLTGLGIGFGFYALASWAGISFWIIFGVALALLLMAISGVANSFFSSILTLTYKDVKELSK